MLVYVTGSSVVDPDNGTDGINLLKHHESSDGCSDNSDYDTSHVNNQDLLQNGEITSLSRQINGLPLANREVLR